MPLKAFEGVDLGFAFKQVISLVRTVFVIKVLPGFYCRFIEWILPGYDAVFVKPTEVLLDFLV